MLTYEDAADFIGVSVHTVRRWIRAGAIPVIRCSRRTHRIRRVDFEEFLRKRSSKFI